MAVETFTTYTEVDPNNHFTVTGTRVTQQSWRNEIAYVYKDFTVGHFGDFTHEFAVRSTRNFANASTTFWMLANAIGDRTALDSAGETRMGFYSFHTDGRLLLVERHGGSSYSSAFYLGTLDTTYYITVTKTGTALSAKIYSDSGRTNLLATLTLTLQADRQFRYLYVADSFNSATADYSAGFVENLNLNEASEEDVSASGLWPREYWISGYSPRYQRRQVIGYHSASGDLRAVEVNASGHLFIDIEVVVSSGLPVVVQSGLGVLISGQHVYVESGVYVIADIAESGIGVQVQSGLHVIVSGQPVTISGDHVFVESGTHVIISGQPVTISGDHVFVESGIAQLHGYHHASGVWVPLAVTASGCLAITYCTSGGLF